MIERTIFREEHHIFRKTVRRFVDREIVPFHAQWEKDGIVPRELWLKAGAEGLLCCTVPEEYGGQGVGLLGMTTGQVQAQHVHARIAQKSECRIVSVLHNQRAYVFNL